MVYGLAVQIAYNVIDVGGVYEPTKTAPFAVVDQPAKL